MSQPSFAQALHEAEVRDVILRFYPNGDLAAEYLNNVEKARGKEATEKLRSDCRKAWKKKQRGEK